VIITPGVIFAYAAVELVGTAASETANPAKVMPKAINSVACRIAVFLRRLADSARPTSRTNTYRNLVALLVIVPALIDGWYAVRPRVLEMARERVGYTGNYPVVAETPLMDELLEKDGRETPTTKKADSE
jgi:hypothetical protein